MRSARHLLFWTRAAGASKYVSASFKPAISAALRSLRSSARHIRWGHHNPAQGTENTQKLFQHKPCCPPTPKPTFWTPRKNGYVPRSWERTKEGLTSTFRGDLGIRKGVPTGRFGPQKVEFIVSLLPLKSRVASSRAWARSSFGLPISRKSA